MATLKWTEVTPIKDGAYDPLLSKYVNLRYSIKTFNVYHIKSSDMANLPGIAFNMYGTTDLWHILLSVNGIVDPINEIYVGRKLIIPVKAELIDILLQTSGSTSVVI